MTADIRDSRRISRRHLIRSGAAATLLAASSVGVRAEPVRRGTLRLAAPGRGTGLAGDVFGRLVAPGSVFDCLAEIGPDGRLHGELAESWEPRDGARLWAVTLRDGVRFHDGQEFGAEDALASLRFHASRLAGLGIASMRKTGPRQILIALDAPDPGFPFLLADPALVMLPAADPEGALTSGTGTGLYRLDGPATPAGLRLRRVAAHYKDGRAGWFEAVELLRIADPADRSAALLAGRVDAAASPDPARLRARPRGPVLVSAQSGMHLRLATRGPDAPALAAALKAGLDRAALRDGFLGGAGGLAADHPLPIRPEDAPCADPGLARHILARACIDRATLGFGPGLSGLPGLDSLVRSLSDFAAAAGLTLSVAENPQIRASLAPAQPTGDLALRRFPKDGLADPAGFDRLLAKSRSAQSSALRHEIHGQLGRILAQEALIAVPVFAHARFAHSARLTHLGHIGALDMLDSGRIAERWHYGSYG